MSELFLRFGEDHKLDYVVTKLTGISLVEVPQRFGRTHQETASINFKWEEGQTPDGWLSRQLDEFGESFTSQGAEDLFWDNLRADQESLLYDVDVLRKIAFEAKLSRKEVELAELIMSGSPTEGIGAQHSLSIALDVSQARVRGLLFRLRAKMEMYLTSQGEL